ncbi:MAG: response regulator [Acidiferrobacterales bacterium]|nr:response regulator [Acidiferrobacterales bacterium]
MAPTDTKPRILMVDDSKVMRKAFSKILQDEYDMLEAENGEEGWNILSSDDSIQLVISDIEMPELDGFGLLQRIRNDEDVRLKNIPVIVITGAEDDQTKQEALDTGATDFVIKPVDKVQLLARTRAQVKMNQASRDLAEANTSLKEEATLDPQTGLTSRKYFMQRCDQDISAAMRHQEPMVLMRVNMDRYKKVYAEVGDDGFEELLNWIAGILLETARTEDTVSRVSGAEFAILAPKTEAAGGLAFGRRLRDAINAKPFTSGNTKVGVTLSIGIVNIGVDQEIETDSILKLAEERAEAARASGGDCIFDGTNTIGGKDKAQAETTKPAKESHVGDDGPRGFAAIYIDQALEMLARGDTNEIDPYLADLLLEILPLLEHANSALNLNLGFAMSAMRDRLEAIKADELMANSSN